VLEVEGRGGGRFLEAAYGTSRDRRDRGYGVRVSRAAALAAAGLERPSTFLCSRRITISPANGGFDTGGGTRALVIGRLDAAALERMNAVCARVHAVRDTLAERRAEKRRSRAIAATDGTRSVAVEHRRLDEGRRKRGARAGGAS
jgi:hypothetical protein